MLYILGTNVGIGIIKDSPSQPRKKLLQLDVNDVAISQIVLYELEFGVCRSQQQQRNRKNLNAFIKGSAASNRVYAELIGLRPTGSF